MYRPRLTDKILSRKLKGKGAVLIQGPKWCGKTTSAEQMAKSILYMVTHINEDETKHLDLSTLVNVALKK